jgi:apolipoprotein N-acyltransferase
MFNKHFYHGLTSGLMASLAGIIYNHIYFFATQTDFSGLVNLGTIISLNLIVCIIFSSLYYFLQNRFKKNGIFVFHLIISIISFAAVIIPISVSLPLSIKNPELFPGLAVPMVFFPVLAWFTFKPLFLSENK